MNVLSLFDGMSCGQIALRDLGFEIDRYYASEIDKHAIAQTKLNFPNTSFLGDVREVDVSKLEPIDLLIGGSPCQSFSFAGKMNGMSTTTNKEVLSLEQYLQLKKDGFEFQGQSYLFWEYIRILRDIQKYNPDVFFLLENVKMAKKWEEVLTTAIGINGVHINSALVSAQNRRRIYWTNILTRKSDLFGTIENAIPQPADSGEVISDILEDNVDEKYYLSEAVVSRILSKVVENISPEQTPAVVNPAYRKPGGVIIPKDIHKCGAIIAKYPDFPSAIGERPCVLQVGCAAKRSGGVRIVDKSGTLLATYYKGVSTFGDRTQVMVVKQKPAHEDNQTQPEKPDSV